MKTVKLDDPITVDGISVSELTIRRPKVRDYLAIERLNGSDLSKEVTFCQSDISCKRSYRRVRYCRLCESARSIKRFFFTNYPKDLRSEVITLSSIIGSGIEPLLEMEISDFILWHEAAGKVKCQLYL